MKKLIAYGIFSLLMLMPAIITLAEQPQQQPKNYQALIAQNGRAICEENLAQVLAVNDELKQQVLKLQDELKAVKEAKKPAPVPEAK